MKAEQPPASRPRMLLCTFSAVLSGTKCAFCRPQHPAELPLSLRTEPEWRVLQRRSPKPELQLVRAWNSAKTLVVQMQSLFKLYRITSTVSLYVLSRLRQCFMGVKRGDFTFCLVVSVLQLKQQPFLANTPSPLCGACRRGRCRACWTSTTSAPDRSRRWRPWSTPSRER